MPLELGIDIGGTCTDIVILDESRVRIHKFPSTPDDPAQGVLAGLVALSVTREPIPTVLITKARRVTQRSQIG